MAIAKKSVIKNYIYNLIYQLLIIIMPIITTPYLSRTLGVNSIGIYSYTISIVTYFILFGSLGISIYGQREVAYVQDDVNKRSKIFFELFFLRLITMPIAMLIFYITYGIKGEYSLYYNILLLEMIANAIDISWFYQGIELFKKIAVRNICIKIISVISIFLFIKGPDDVVKYLIIYVLTTLLGNVALWIDLKKYIVKVNFKKLEILKKIKPAIAFFIPQVAVQIYTVLDKTMIGTITADMTQVGYYEQTQKIIKMLLTVITSLSVVMIPRIAKCFSDGDNKKIKEYMNKSFRFVYMLALPLIFGIIATSDNFVPIFFGPGYDNIKILMKCLSPIILFIGMGNIIGSQYLMSIKKQGKFTICVTCGAIVNVILNLLLIYKYKALGAVISTVIAEFVVAAMQCYFIRKEFKIRDIICLSKNYLGASIIMFILTIVTDILVKTPIYAIILQVIVGVLSYFIILLLAKDELILEFKIKIEKIIKKLSFK